MTRIFASSAFFQTHPEEPIRSVITETPEAVIVAWHLEPGQSIAPHRHPHGQDTWTVLQGKGDYALDAEERQAIAAGDVVIAPMGSLHGVYNSGTEVLRLISVVSPANAGYELHG